MFHRPLGARATAQDGTSRIGGALASGAGALPVAADARAHVHNIVKRAGSSFFWAMRSLERDRREAVYAIYAYCREVDDIADEAAAVDDKMARLAAWREEIAAVYRGAPATPIGQALAAAVVAHGLPREEFLLLIDAVEIDAQGRESAPDLAELETYCRGVAGAVGMLLIRIFGAKGADAEAFAIALGEALQLTNILRDVVEDAGEERIYLPREWLEDAGVNLDLGPPTTILDQEGLVRTCEKVAARAHERFAEAERYLARCDRRQLRAALIMRDVYHRLLLRLEARGWRRLDEPVRVRKLEKIAILLRRLIA